MLWYRSNNGFKNAKGKTISEQFLHNALTYTEVEAHLVDCFRGRVKEWNQPKIDQVRYAEVIFNNSQLPFYEVIVKWTSDEDEEKGQKVMYLIPAESPADAENRVHDYLASSVDNYTIEDTKKTKILGVWHPHNEIWRGDFLNRMDVRKEAGKCTLSFGGSDESSPPEKVPNIKGKKSKSAQTAPGLFDKTNSDQDIDNNPEGEEIDD